MSKIRKLETKKWKLLTTEWMHHLKGDVDQLYLPRNAGGWGLAQLQTMYKTTTIGLAMYLKDSEDALLQLVREHDGRKKLFFIQKEAKKFTQEMDLPNLDKRVYEPTSKFAKRAYQKEQHQAQNFLEKEWEDKAPHGRYLKRVKDVDNWSP